MYDNLTPNFMANSSQDFPMLGYDVQNTRFNPTEQLLSPSNVSRLVPYRSIDTDCSVIFNSSPTVVNGIVYVCGHDGTLYAFQTPTVQVSTAQPLWTASAFQPPTVQVPTFQPLWTASIDKPSSDANFHSSPTVVNGVVYVGSSGGTLYAFNAATGQTLWTAPTDDRFQSSPTVANGVVYIGSGSNALYAFNATTGQTLWTAPTASIIFGSPAVANDVVYIASGDTIYGFNAATGKCLWTAFYGGYHHQGHNISSPYGIISSPVVANDVVYVASEDGKLHAFHAFKHKFLGKGATGKTLWTADIGKPLIAESINSSPAVANGVVYFGSWSKKVYAFNAATGQTLWTASTGDRIQSSPVVANGVVYVCSDKLYAFDAATGQTLWTSSTSSEQSHSCSPAVANGVVYAVYLCTLVAFHLG